MTQPAKTKKQSTLNKPYISFKEREYFTENLALLLKAAVPVGQALASLEATAKSKQMKKSLKQMQLDIEAGYLLSDTLSHTGIVSSQTLALIRLGEESGHLVENLQIAAQQEEKRHLFRAKVRSALIYPAFVMSLTLVVGLGVAWFLLPKLANTFSQLQVGLPTISRYMIGFGQFLQAHGVVAVPLFLLACLIIIYVLFFAPPTKHIGKKLLFGMPGIGRLMREVEIAQFGYLLSTLLDAGLPIVRAVQLLSRASDAPQYSAFYKYLAESLDNGYSFKDSMIRYKGSQKLLPPAVQQMVIAGEKSGSLSEVLRTVARTYEQKSDVTTQNLESIIEPVMLIVVWVGVMLVAVAVIVPIYSLTGGLNR